MATGFRNFTDVKPWNSDDAIRVLPRYDLVFRALRASSAISTHREFYHWLQSDVRLPLPHQTLLAAWGDFATGQLIYDISSLLPGVNTKLLNEVGGMDLFMERIFTRLNQSGRGWLVIADLHSVPERSGVSGVDVGTRQYRQATADVRAILAYKMHDEREP
jgi:hypothetical protein